MPLDIIIADDHSVVRDGLRQLLQLNENYRVLATATSSEELLEQCRRKLPDLIIVDLSMPGMGGIEGIRRLLIKWPNLVITVFSIYKNPQLVKRIIEMGCKGFITKSSESDIIINGIQALASGEQFISPDVEINFEINTSYSTDTLSPKEFEIFRCITEGFGIKEISNKLFLSEKTIANNISIIKNKLNVSSITELVHIAIQEGLLVTDF